MNRIHVRSNVQQRNRLIQGLVWGWVIEIRANNSTRSAHVINTCKIYHATNKTHPVRHVPICTGNFFKSTNFHYNNNNLKGGIDINMKLQKRTFYAAVSRKVEDIGMGTYRGNKETNEDRFTAFTVKINKRKWVVACVFDGHGGSGASAYATEHIKPFLTKYLEHYHQKSSSTMDLAQVLKNTIHDLDSGYVELAKKENEAKTSFNPDPYPNANASVIVSTSRSPNTSAVTSVGNSNCVGPGPCSGGGDGGLGLGFGRKRGVGLEGTTATIALVGRNELYIGYVGDSPAVLYHTNGETEDLFGQKHKPDDPLEKKRIEKAGGTVVVLNGVPRLQGMCSVSRAIGDYSLKGRGMISEATVVHRSIDGSYGALLLCSDGLFDGCNKEVLYKLLIGSRDTHEAAKRFNFEAELGGSQDNITSLIVPLDGWLDMKTAIKDSALYEYMHEQYQHKITNDSADNKSKNITGLAETIQENLRLKNLFSKMMNLIEVYFPRDYTDKQKAESIKQFSETGQGQFDKAIFRAFDSDCDGSISFIEFLQGMQKLGTMYSEEEIREFFEQSDLDGNQKLQINEFRRLLRTILQVHKLDKMP